nr:hypothetical protein [Tanacetum cinerariifolium]
MDQRMNEAVKVAVQIQSDRLCDEAQAENDEFLKTIDENMHKIIKEQVKEQVKVQVSKILPKIKQVKTNHEMEEPSHLEFETGADDQPIEEPSQHLEWFSQQKKPPTLDREQDFSGYPQKHSTMDKRTSKAN